MANKMPAATAAAEARPATPNFLPRSATKLAPEKPAIAARASHTALIRSSHTSAGRYRTERRLVETLFHR